MGRANTEDEDGECIMGGEGASKEGPHERRNPTNAPTVPTRHIRHMDNSVNPGLTKVVNSSALQTDVGEGELYV